MPVDIIQEKMTSAIFNWRKCRQRHFVILAFSPDAVPKTLGIHFNIVGYWGYAVFDSYRELLKKKCERDFFH